MDRLFVCVNNVGRSQWAMEYWNQLHPEGAASAGTRVDEPDGIVADWKGGSEIIVAAAKEDGIDIAHNVRTQLKPAMLEVFSSIIIMAQIDTHPEWLNIGGKVVYWKVEDPRDMNIEDVRKIRDQVKQRINELGSRLA